MVYRSQGSYTFSIHFSTFIPTSQARSSVYKCIAMYREFSVLYITRPLVNTGILSDSV